MFSPATAAAAVVENSSPRRLDGAVVAPDAVARCRTSRSIARQVMRC